MTDAIASAALEMVGTPFGHQGREPGKRLDCLGLLVHALGDDARAYDRSDYVRRPDARRAIEVLEARATRLRCSIDDAPVGSVIVFCFGLRKIPRHFAIRTQTGMVHAEAGVGTVDEPISHRWRRRYWGAFAWRR